MKVTLEVKRGQLQRLDLNIKIALVTFLTFTFTFTFTFTSTWHLHLASSLEPFCVQPLRRGVCLT